MQKCGVFGNNKNGEPTPVTGKDRWMLCAEGASQEWDVSAFNLRVVKTKTVKKTINADKEEWCIIDDYEQMRKEWELSLNPADIGGGLTEDCTTAANGRGHASIIVANGASDLLPSITAGSACRNGSSDGVGGGSGSGGGAVAAGGAGGVERVCAENGASAAVGSNSSSGGGNIDGSSAQGRRSSGDGCAGRAIGVAEDGSSPAKRRRVDNDAGSTVSVPGNGSAAAAAAPAAASTSASVGAAVNAAVSGGGSDAPNNAPGRANSAVKIATALPPGLTVAQKLNVSRAPTPVGLMAKQGTLSGWLRPANPVWKKSKERVLTEADMTAAYTPGDKVEANWCNKGRFYPGCIETINTDSMTGEITYAIRYVDGDYEASVPFTRTRLPKQAPTSSRGRSSRGSSMDT